MRRWIAGIIISGLCTTGAVAAGAQTPQQLGWRVFPREIDALKSSYQGNYDRKIVKQDYFIFQHSVTIDHWLKTNGGDVLIVADEVIINAPIDTRVRFRMVSNYWVANPCCSDLAVFDQGQTNLQSLDFLLWRSPVPFGGFDSLYLWQEKYDDQSKRFVYEVPARHSIKVDDRPTKDKPIELAELPSGQVPLAVSPSGIYTDARPPNGADAPQADIIWENVRSGNIRIFANKLRLCGDCITAVAAPIKALSQNAYASIPERFGSNYPASPQGPNDTPGDAFDIEQSVFFEVSGIKGGRGAAGSLSACPSIYSPDDTSTCTLLRQRLGGLSGKPGRGGDAGSIELHFVNYAPTADELHVLTQASHYEGGFPPQTHQQRTPRYGGSSLLWSRRGGFENEVPVPNLNSLKGNGGALRIDQLDTNQAISAATSLLLKAGLEGNYSTDLLVLQARSDPSVFSVSPVDTMRTFLAEELISLQKQLTNSIAPALSNQQVPATTRSDFFSTLSCIDLRNASMSMPKDQRDYLSHICEFDLYTNHDGVRSFLYHIKGLYNLVPLDINSKISTNEISAELSITQQLITQVAAEVSELHQFFYESVTDVQQHELSTALEALKAKRAALEAAFEERRDSAGLGSALQTLRDGFSNLAQGEQEIAAANWIAAAPQLYEGLRKLGTVFTASRIPLNSPDLASLDIAISEATSALNNFVERVADVKRAMVASQRANLSNLIAARSRFEQYRTNARFAFADTVRAVMQQHLQTADNDTLTNNVGITNSLINSASVPQPLNIGALTNMCQGAPPRLYSNSRRNETGLAGCLAFSRDPQHAYVITTSNNRARDFPLLVVSPGEGTIAASFGTFALDELIIGSAWEE
jgi:hypothetical protein